MAVCSHKRSYAAAGLIIFLALALFAAGCTQPGGAGHATTLKITGSTTVLPVAQAAADAFMKDHLTANIQVTGGGSSVGVQAVGEGIAEMGMSSRDLKPEERAKYRDLIDVTIANDGIAIIVHPSNKVPSLTMAQLKEIYAGNTTNWKDVGGPDMIIVVVGRDSASGTREFFSESVMKKQDFTPYQLEKNSNGAVKQTIAQTPGAIGYVGLGYIDADIRAVPINVNDALVEPTIANVVAKTYPIARPLIMITNGAPEGLAKTYLDYLLSPAGQAIVAEEGFVPITA